MAEQMENVPPNVHVGNFIKSRISEINSMIYVLENPTSGLASRKKLPNHMRRRAMSHNVKRIPHRLRKSYQALREKCNTREGKNKVPRKRYRRRPRNLAEDYKKRQKSISWLETHIWHAKRFFMASKWGYKIPLRPCDKSYRACYRATTEHCLIQDISYFKCLELSGNTEVILDGLRRHVAPQKTFEKSFLMSGSREGTAFLYKRNSYPKNAIGEVNFMWSPEIEKKLWIWIHPSFFQEVLSEFSVTFDLKDDSMEIENVKMKIVKLNRFKLIGPLSQAILSKVFVPLQTENRQNKDWVSEFYDEEKSESLKAQSLSWNTMKSFTSPAQLSPRIIVPIVTYDTRITTPKFKTKAVNEFEDEDLKLESLLSPIWDEKTRERIESEIISKAQIDLIRSQKFVPGLEFESGKTENVNNPAFPVLAIQNPGNRNDNKRLGFGCGWDLICPSGYGMALWMSLVLNGGRAGGLRETESHLRESGLFNLPPDTSAGKAQEDQKRIESSEKHFRLPPAKRRNYIKLGFPTPFHPPWQLLVQEWSSSSDFYVLRNTQILRELSKSLKNGALPGVDVAPGALIGVRILYESKGLLSYNAHICVPKNEDEPPVEPFHDDPNESVRAQCVQEHKSKLKKLAAKRKKDKNSFSSKQIVEEQSEKLKTLWLPSCDKIKDVCSRQICGFVVNGDFCFTEATSYGLGYVAYDSLKEIFKNNIKNKVLIRTINSTQYRFAKYEICVD